MNTAIVLTVIAPDQPGIIQIVSSALKKHGGNWTQSSMSTLAGQFAGILLASVPDANADACLADLRDLEDRGIHITAEVCDEVPEPGNTSEFSLDLVGNDHPGIVHTITTLLASQNISVDDLETRVESGSMAGGSIFRASARLQVPEDVDVAALEAEIEDLANDLMVEIDFEK
jgi:glycine cleavage system regulatory protein